MTFRNILQIISFGLLFYLLADNFTNFDFAASKNNAFTSMQKMEIDSIQSIDTVKQKAKQYLDTIRKVHRKHSDESVVNFWLCFGLLLVQIILFSMKQATKDRS